VDKKEIHKIKYEYREVVSPYNVLNENRLKSSYPRVPSSSIPGSLLQDTGEEYMRD
jgi:pyruvate/oxaloacetate carboxyltransferase